MRRTSEEDIEEDFEEDFEVAGGTERPRRCRVAVGRRAGVEWSGWRRAARRAPSHFHVFLDKT